MIRTLIVLLLALATAYANVACTTPTEKVLMALSFTVAVMALLRLMALIAHIGAPQEAR